MQIAIPIIIILIPILIANLIDSGGKKSTTTLFELIIAGLNIPLLLAGLALLFIPPQVTTLIVESGFPLINFSSGGWVLIFMSVWAILACIRPLRVLLARLIPINPASPVHTVALVLAGYLIGNTLFALSQEVLLGLAETELTVTIVDIIVQQLAFVLVAFIGVGLLTRRNLQQISQRLGLVRPTIEQLLWGVAVIVLLIGIQWAVGVIWVLVDPEQAAALGEINDLLLGNVDTLGEWFILAVASGVGEEILFRGSLQPVFGIVPTALLFAIVHVQYGLSPITAAVFIIGLILGLLRRKTNTTTTIFVHFSYNFLLGLFALLAAYVQGLVG